LRYTWQVSDLGPATVTVAAKVPEVLADGIAALAAERGITRSSLMRELAEAALSGQLQIPSVEEIAQRDHERAVERLRLSVRLSSELRRAPRQGDRWNVQEMYRRGVLSGVIKRRSEQAPSGKASGSAAST